MDKEDSKIIADGYKALSQDMRLLYDIAKRIEGIVLFQLIVFFIWMISITFHVAGK